ncbi:putative small nuclear ribonucleoprotein Sm D3 [Paratrimastix pyriformis]|uniref:Small nuclear ribonucleoprotein Sm D3 n=1 Tax=Paratrimastix pyriformis TaxID=342808 RepID=A0ABQ8UPX6_9EUKA|nr:putative small nuclear ribonucleoprotein Sm D3 [Paratrimastix pyriformis]
MSIGIPIKLLHEAEGHTVTIELKTHEIYRGHLLDTEDNMNCKLQNATLTHRDGHVTRLEHVYIRGSHVRFMILPDMLQNAPMFRRLEAGKAGQKGRGLGLGLGRAQVLRQKAAQKARARGPPAPGGPR